MFNSTKGDRCYFYHHKISSEELYNFEKTQKKTSAENKILHNNVFWITPFCYRSLCLLARCYGIFVTCAVVNQRFRSSLLPCVWLLGDEDVCLYGRYHGCLTLGQLFRGWSRLYRFCADDMNSDDAEKKDFLKQEPSLPQPHPQQGRKDGGSAEVEAEVPNRKLRGPRRSSGGSARASLPSLSAIVNIQCARFLRSYSWPSLLFSSASLVNERLCRGFSSVSQRNQQDKKSSNIAYLLQSHLLNVHRSLQVLDLNVTIMKFSYWSSLKGLDVDISSFFFFKRM